MFHLRKTTFIGLIILLAASGAVVLANPEHRALQCYDSRLETLKTKLSEIKGSQTDPFQILDKSDREAVNSLDEFLKTYRTPETYRFETMKNLAVLVLSTEPVVNYLSVTAGAALPAPTAGLAPAAAVVPAPTPSVAPPASAPPKPSFKIADDEGC